MIDETTPEQTIAILGQPKSDKDNNRFFLIRDEWFEKGIGKKLHILHYETLEGFSDVRLGFIDSKLVVISLVPKKLAALAFENSYPDLKFRFGTEIVTPADFKTDNSPNHPTHLSVQYELDAATAKVFALAYIYASRVNVIHLISRTLENKTGSNLLK